MLIFSNIDGDISLLNVHWRVDCKTVVFFSKSVKKSVKRGVRVSFSLVPDILFDCQCVVEYPRIRTVLQSNWGVAMIKLCLWSKKSAIWWVFGPQTAGPPAVFLCGPYFVLWREWQGSHNNSQKTTKLMNSNQKHRNTSKVSLLYLF